MRINLTRKEYSDINYEIITFPDKQKHLKFIDNIEHKMYYHINTRITNGDELFILMQCADILNRHGVQFDVNIYYLLGARTDRVFSFNEPFSLKIILNILDNLGAKHIQIYDIHNLDLCDDYLYSSYNHHFPSNDKTYVFPDKGASQRYTISNRNKNIICGKIRNIETGELSGFSIENPRDCTNETLVVIDDLCDGGGTFIGIAEKLRELNPSKLILSVSHAIQLSGLEKVAHIYDEVHITNSYCDWDMVILPKNVIVRNILN